MLILKNRQLLKSSLVYLSQNGTKIRFRHEGVVPLFTHARKYPNKVALYDNVGNYTYGNIFNSAKELSNIISSHLDGRKNERVSFLCSNDVNYVITLWAIWMSGQIAVPLSPSHPEDLLQYYTSDSQSKLLLATPEYKDVVHKISKSTNSALYVIYEEFQKKSRNKPVDPDDLEIELPNAFYEHSNALILYTSGTTQDPKGVVLSHKNINVQTKTLLEAWRWSPDDTILHTLPLHHIHGTVNALFCPLFAGATTVLFPKFSAPEVWSSLLGTNKNIANVNVNVYMGVPTIYAKLVEEWEKNLQGQKDNIKTHLENKVRLMVSGSSALPTSLYEKWLKITGHRLLERYGMTETGMILSNEYDSDREPGFVGIPLPGVSVRLSENIEGIERTELECTNENGTLNFNRNYLIDVKGELFVKGDSVFKEYYNRPELTKKAFTQTGWFETGDICEYVPDKNKFRILGRSNIDVIKTGGHKVSALQIEARLLEHPDIQDSVVVGVKDEVWGERVAAVIVPRKGTTTVTLEDVKKWTEEYLPNYSVPTVLKIVEEIPRNALGKVNKKDLVKNVFK